MLFRWKSKEPVGTAEVPRPASGSRDVRPCPTLAKALKTIGALDKPRILDIGPLCGATAVFLANRGARVCVESFIPPPPLPKKTPDGEVKPVEPFVIDQPTDGYDLVLAWEAIDFTPPDRLEEVVGEFKRLVRENGLLLMLSRNSTGARKVVEDIPGRFRVEAEDSVRREPSGTRTLPRWVHLNREIERVLRPLSVQGIRLQRDQTREILAIRKPTR